MLPTDLLKHYLHEILYSFHLTFLQQLSLKHQLNKHCEKPIKVTILIFDISYSLKIKFFNIINYKIWIFSV